MSEPEPIWVKSKWTTDQLRDQMIECHLLLKHSGIGCGIGKPLVQDREMVDDLISVHFLRAEMTDRLEKDQTVIPLPEECVNRIEVYPKQKIARFHIMKG